MSENQSTSIIRNLRITFSISIILLVISLLSSFLSVQKLIDNSQLVNHTHEVLIESENVISYMKDAETGQRGYMVTLDKMFLQPYYGAQSKALNSCQKVSNLTIDNPVQQERCKQIKELINAKSRQMKVVIEVAEKNERLDEDDKSRQYQEMITGKQLMDDLRIVINNVKAEEKKLLEQRVADQQAYIDYSRMLVIFAALISIIITLLSYIRIKKDMDERIARQLEDERKYHETSRRIAAMETTTGRIAQGDYSSRSGDLAEDELGRIGKALNNMADHLQENFAEINRRIWLQEGAVKLGDAMRGERNVRHLSTKLIGSLTDYISAPIGTMYVADKNTAFQLTGTHAATNPSQQLGLGEGLAGQSMVSQKMEIVTDLPPDYLGITSTTGAASPVSLLILPLIFEGESIGVIELGLMRQPDQREIELLRGNMENISIAVNAALDHQRLQDLLEETQAQSEELQAQHSELENLNSELEAQAQSLQSSEEELKVQQEELQQTNAELEERTTLLEEKNTEIETKAEELALTTKYKSEFLANMSHELRTPLNSILLLSRLLSDNNEKNLSTDQVEYARVIQSSGNGLLWLIDEILDLSKIESGKMEVEYERLDIQPLINDLKGMFSPLAREKGLELIIDIHSDIPKAIETDRMRLDQILKNLLSNAVKFTEKGIVTLEVSKCEDNNRSICFVVKDTGIGIPKEKQHLIFEAFQQADGSTKRKFGGTGLGLSISRELAKLLGGEIKLSSTPDEGSIFTLYIPIERFRELPGMSLAEKVGKDKDEAVMQAEQEARDQNYAGYISAVIPEGIEDDRATIKKGDQVILILEDDVNFAKSVLEFTRKKGYKGIVTVRGDEGINLAIKYRPTGILLDIELPVKSGWEVMDDLKNNPETRHIPVHMMSSHSLKKQSLQKGAVDFIEKPIAFEQMQEIFGKIEQVLTRNPKKVLIIEDNTKHAEALAYFLDSNKINAEVKTDVSDSIKALKSGDLDCVILDMGIPANNSYELLEEIKKNEGMENLPVIIFTGKSLSMAEEKRIKKYADSIVVKTAHSYQRMLDEVSLFLHLVEEKKSGGNRQEYKKFGGLNQVLNNKTVLIVDDDIRNIFSLSKALENLKLNVITATDGKEALQKLAENKTVDIVLLDMMMPEMDGYETARRIREHASWSKLPIIAVTAKAMTGDREKCINAGASDYITKPVDIDQLLSLLRVWLYDRN